MGTREAIIQAVWWVVATAGPAGVSVRSVATAAGVSAGTVQHHFPTKQLLVRGAVEAMLAGAAEAHPDASGEVTSRSTLLELLTHSLGRADGQRTGTSVYYSFVAAGVADPWIGEQLAAAKRGVRGRVAECLVAQVPGLGDVDAAARLLVATADGATLAVYLGDATVDEARAIVEQTLDRLADQTLDPG